MRLFPALFGALLITLAVFLFMHSLIRQDTVELVSLLVHENVRVIQPEPEPETPPEQPREVEPDMSVEPVMEPLRITTPTPLAPAQALEIPALELATGDLAIATAGDRWRAPLGAGGVAVGAPGVDAQGYVEVVPFDTRRPNVPTVAWENRIDGWVLVAFAVTPDGRTRDVRVLDASPRGVFEEKVIAAVEDWRYRVSFAGQARGSVVLTQKVEVHWKNYPQNLPNVD